MQVLCMHQMNCLFQLCYKLYTPEDISEPLFLNHLLVVENLKGCDALDESDWSNLYTTLGDNFTCCEPPSIKNLPPLTVTVLCDNKVLLYCLIVVLLQGR